MGEGKVLAKTKAEERHRKLAQIKRKRRSQLSVIAGIIVAFLLINYWLHHSSLLNVTNINIAGNKFVPSNKIVEACNVSRESNLLSIPTTEIRDRLLKNPWIQDVKVIRAIPHTLQVNIVERKPVALLSHTNKFYVIDENKFVIAELATTEGADVPIITDVPVDRIRAGRRIVNSSLDNALRCLKAMNPEFRDTINLLSASSVDKLSLYNKDNIEILYGEAKQVHDKNKVLQTILKQQGRQVVFIDIRSYPHSDPVIKRMDSVP